MQSYITQIIQYTETKYPGVVYAYDVVNEVINDNGCKLRTGTQSLYGAIFGEEDNTYITKAFEYARATLCGEQIDMAKAVKSSFPSKIKVSDKQLDKCTFIYTEDYRVL